MRKHPPRINDNRSPISYYMNQYITYFEIAAFIASLAAWGTIKKSSYLRWFPLLLLIIVSLETYETFFRAKKNILNALAYNIQIPLQHLLYLVILYFAIEKRSFKKFPLIAAIGYTLFAVVTDVFFTVKDHFNVLAYSLGSVLIIISIILKFYEMLQHPTGLDFLKDPFFYMLFAFLLFNMGTLPLFVMGNWLYYTKGFASIVHMLIIVTSILNYILYSTYSIAFIWMIRKNGTS